MEISIATFFNQILILNMKVLRSYFPALMVLLMVSFLFISCNKDEVNDLTLDSTAPTDSPTTNDPSDPNDTEDSFSDCFAIVFPIEINFADGSMLSITSGQELETAIDNWFAAQGENAEEPTLTYPVSVILNGESIETLIQNEDELDDLLDACEDDYDLADCFTVTYPVQGTLADGTTLTVNNDEELLVVLDSFDLEDLTLVYPINLTLDDGSSLVLQSDDDLEDALVECFGDDDECECEDDDDEEEEEDDDEDEECFDDLDFTDCFTINYPISIMDPAENVYSANNDEELEDILDAIEDANESSGEDYEEDYKVVYPISVTLVTDGSTVTLNNDDETEALLESCDD